MWGCTPGTYNNLEACETVAMGYSKESKCDWCVMEKSIEGNDSVWYKPCMVSDVEMAKKDGWSRHFSFYYRDGRLQHLTSP